MSESRTHTRKLDTKRRTTKPGLRSPTQEVTPLTQGRERQRTLRHRSSSEQHVVSPRQRTPPVWWFGKGLIDHVTHFVRNLYCVSPGLGRPRRLVTRRRAVLLLWACGMERAHIKALKWILRGFRKQVTPPNAQRLSRLALSRMPICLNFIAEARITSVRLIRRQRASDIVASFALLLHVQQFVKHCFPKMPACTLELVLWIERHVFCPANYRRPMSGCGILPPIRQRDWSSWRYRLSEFPVTSNKSSGRSSISTLCLKTLGRQCGGFGTAFDHVFARTADPPVVFSLLIKPINKVCDLFMTESSHLFRVHHCVRAPCAIIQDSICRKLLVVGNLSRSTLAGGAVATDIFSPSLNKDEQVPKSSLDDRSDRITIWNPDDFSESARTIWWKQRVGHARSDW